MIKNLKQLLSKIPLYLKIRRYGLLNTLRRLHYRRILGRFKSIDIATQSNSQPCEIYLLTSAWDWDLALWALYSFYYWAQVNWPLVVLDDGSLRNREISQISRLFPNVRLIRAAEADHHAQSFLRARQCTTLAIARSQNMMMRKFVDPVVFCQSNKFILLDSDVLFFSHPKSLLKSSQSTDMRFHFLRDYQDSYSIDAATSLDKLGISLPSKINTGLAVIPKSAFDFIRIESVVSKGVVPLDQYGQYAEQTLLALIAPDSGFDFLSDDYKVVTCPCNSRTDVSRHYVGPVRKLFFDEGVPIFLNSLME